MACNDDAQIRHRNPLVGAEHTRTALNVLVGVMRNTKAPPPARIAAANAILDRGWGKAPQAIANGEDGALELIHRIERVIVHPENPHRKNL